MAVEARHIPNYYGLPPLSGTTTESFIPMYNTTNINNINTNNIVNDMFVSSKGNMKAESGLTSYANVSRKRQREFIDNTMMSCPNGQVFNNRCTFLGDDLSLQLQHQQLEMDQLICQHNENVRMELEERRKRYSRGIIAAVEQSINQKLKAKDDEIEKMAKINWALEEKVKSLSVEAQIWRDLAHTNEAAAQNLRSNLEQILTAQINERENVNVVADDAQSCCGSNFNEENGEECSSVKISRNCKHCGEGVSSVLLLPCRHLCLCTVCGSSANTCPLCNTPKNASVHVIM